VFNAGGHFPGDWGFPAWDCKNTGGDHRSITSGPNAQPACWTPPVLPGAPTQYKVPTISAATYSSK
jgi:hypothetical protein